MNAWEYRSIPFWDRVEARIERLPEGGCHVFTGSLDTHGYASANRDGIRVLLHRAIWERDHGPLAANEHVCHRCDNPSCVNPHHLFVGSRADNMQDKVRKGRANMRRGDAHPKPMAKVNRDIAEKIKARIAAGEMSSALAAEFGLSRQLVSDIKLGKTWRL